MDMLCLFLGEDYVFVHDRGERMDVAEFSIHFQTPWRFRQDREILLASEDFYMPYSENAPQDWQFDLTGRTDALSSVFDVQVRAFALKMQGAVITDCCLSATDDVTITFSNGVVFEQFIPASRKDEKWRLIDYTNHAHTVCYGEDGSISRE